MKMWLREHLICPECLESEEPLLLEIKEEKKEDILDGELKCPACKSRQRRCRNYSD